MTKERKFIGLKDLTLTLLLSLLTMVIGYIVVPFVTPLGVVLSSIIGGIIPSLLGGFIYVLIQTKAPRIGTCFVYSLVFALFYIIIGVPVNAILFIAAGLIGELTMIHGYGKKWRPLAHYIIHWLTYTYAATFQYLFMRDAAVQAFVSSGMEEAAAIAAVDSYAAVYTAPQNILLFGACTIVAATLGYFIGTKVLRKHFAPAGVA